MPCYGTIQVSIIIEAVHHDIRFRYEKKISYEFKINEYKQKVDQHIHGGYSFPHLELREFTAKLMTIRNNETKLHLLSNLLDNVVYALVQYHPKLNQLSQEIQDELDTLAYGVTYR